MTAIKKEIVKKMIEQYRKRRKTYPSIVDVNGVDKADTDSVWISKTSLLEFFSVRNPTADGVRIYFGCTGKFKPEVDYDCKDEYINQTNLILVATQSRDPQNISMRNSDNIIYNKLVLTDRELQDESKAIYIFGNEGMGDDEHEMCPPPQGGCIEIV